MSEWQKLQFRQVVDLPSERWLDRLIARITKRPVRQVAIDMEFSMHVKEDVGKLEKAQIRIYCPQLEYKSEGKI